MFDFDPRDYDSRDDERHSHTPSRGARGSSGHHDRDHDRRQPDARTRDRDDGDERSLGRGPGSDRQGSDEAGRDRDHDPRWIDRDRGTRERDPEVRDALTRHVYLPRGRDRELVHDRDREYTLRGSESRTLATVGAFRVVSSRDLRDHDGSPADPRSGDLRHLREQGLIETTRVPGYRDHAVSLTKDGRSLLESHRDHDHEHSQTFYAGLGREPFKISRALCSDLVRGRIWNPGVKLTIGDEMRDRIIGALDTGCRRGEVLKIQNTQVDWRHRWIRILKEHSKTEVARVIPFEAGSRLERLLRRRAFLGPDAYVFGEATTGTYVASCKSAWETLLLLANGIKPTRAGSGKRVSNRKALAQIDLHWHDLRHEALSRLADDGVPVHELQLLAGHASVMTTQRYMNARASSLAESMRQARERHLRRTEVTNEQTVQMG